MTKDFSLSGRQREIVQRLREGQAVKQISSDLGLSINTVKDYMKRIYLKAQVHSARELLYQLTQPEVHGAQASRAAAKPIGT